MKRLKRRTDIVSNVTYEAYTGNSSGRKESRTLLKQSSSVKAINANGDSFNALEAHAKESLSVRFPRVRRSPRAWHEEREASQEPRRPPYFLVKFSGVGHCNEKKCV